jgi:hypothetical protein
VRRFPLALLLVGLLGLLAAGGVVLGLVQSPTPTDLLVHNGAGETLSATRIVGTYTSSNLRGDVIDFVFTAPADATEVAKTASGAVAGRRTVGGPTAIAVLQPVQALLSLHRFTEHGGAYMSTKPAADLVPPSQRAHVSGTYVVQVRLEGGYVVQVDFRLDAKDRGQRVLETLVYHLTQVGPWAGR